MCVCPLDRYVGPYTMEYRFIIDRGPNDSMLRERKILTALYLTECIICIQHIRIPSPNSLNSIRPAAIGTHLHGYGAHPGVNITSGYCCYRCVRTRLLASRSSNRGRCAIALRRTGACQAMNVWCCSDVLLRVCHMRASNACSWYINLLKLMSAMMSSV